MAQSNEKTTATPPTTAVVPAGPMTFPQMLDRWKGQIAVALPKHLNPDRMARIALTEFRRNAKLQACDPKSIFAAILQASQIGLEPGLMGLAYLIPYKTECQLIPSYKGLIELARRSDRIQSIEATVVYGNEQFECLRGTETKITHKPCLDGDRGPLRLVYAVATMKDGSQQIEIMTREDIYKIRDQSSSGYKRAQQYGGDNPWTTNESEMWRKTCIRRICKYLPMSVELATAVALDDSFGRQKLDLETVVEGSWAPPPDSEIEERTEEDMTPTEKAAAKVRASLGKHGKIEDAEILGDADVAVDAVKGGLC
jgi:recombination protein RecT